MTSDVRSDLITGFDSWDNERIVAVIIPAHNNCISSGECCTFDLCHLVDLLYPDHGDQEWVVGFCNRRMSVLRREEISDHVSCLDSWWCAWLGIYSERPSLLIAWTGFRAIDKRRPPKLLFSASHHHHRLSERLFAVLWSTLGNWDLDTRPQSPSRDYDLILGDHFIQESKFQAQGCLLLYFNW